MSSQEFSLVETYTYTCWIHGTMIKINVKETLNISKNISDSYSVFNFSSSRDSSNVFSYSIIHMYMNVASISSLLLRVDWIEFLVIFNGRDLLRFWFGFFACSNVYWATLSFKDFLGWRFEGIAGHWLHRIKPISWFLLNGIKWCLYIRDTR